MTRALSVNIAVEGDVDEAALTKVLDSVGIEVARPFVQQGKDRLKENVPRYNEAARYGRWVVLVDLNNDAECAPLLLSSWLPRRNAGIQLRVAVREVEAWLLADREEMARFLGVARGRIPLRPEDEPKPKITLIGIARESRRRAVREDIVPSRGGRATQGPGYTSRMIEFIMRHWDPRRAATAAPSLRRTLDSLRRWGAATE